MKKTRRDKRTDVTAVQITDGSLTISFDLSKLDDEALEEIAEISKREVARRAAQRQSDAHANAYQCQQHRKELP